MSQVPQHPKAAVPVCGHPQAAQAATGGLGMKQACVYTSQDSQYVTEDRAHGKGRPDTYREF